MRTHLADLDELVLRCRDAQARSHIEEAIGCYRVGAFRACIVNTWIAVVYDVMAKLRELSVAGDPNAQKETAKLDVIVNKNDVTGALAFEKEVLTKARDTFELISPNEYHDLERLLIDRQRCAHPSLNRPGEIYAPTAEVARLHIRSAVEHLLAQAPVQGKAALDRVLTTIDSELFPENDEAAVVLLVQGPMGRPKLALLRNVVNALVSALLAYDERWEQRARALRAIRRLHRADIEPLLAARLKQKADSVAPDEAKRLLRFTVFIEDTWQYLTAAATVTLRMFIQRVSPMESPEVFPWALDVPDLAISARPRIASLSKSNLTALIEHNPRVEYLDRALEIYGESGSYGAANSIATNLVSPLAHVAETKHFLKVIDLICENGEIRGSFEHDDLVDEFRRKSRADLNLIDERILKDKDIHHLLPADKRPKKAQDPDEDEGIPY